MAATTTTTPPAQKSTTSQIDPAQQIIQLTMGYMPSAAIYAVTRLGIPDLLAQGPRSAADLAKQTGSNEDFLYRAMRALAIFGVFQEGDRHTFSLTPAGEQLQDRKGSLRPLVLWMTNKFHFDVWGDMHHAIKTGENATEHVYGKPVFECFEPGSEVATEFNNAMTNISAANIPAILDSYSFSGVKTLVDVGCGHGRLLCDILSAYPQMNGILFDMETVVAGAKTNINECRLHDRVRVLHGDFFESVPKGGDAYMMQHIIHDWDDEKSLIILKNVRRALEGVVDGKLILFDSIVTADNSADFAKWKDLEMMLMPGGRERTEQQFRELLGRAGFKVTRVIPKVAMVGMVEAVVV
jgi:SAM-dependent methyltransferase